MTNKYWLRYFLTTACFLLGIATAYAEEKKSIYRVEARNGQVYRLEGPSGLSKEEILEALRYHEPDSALTPKQMKDKYSTGSWLTGPNNDTECMNKNKGKVKLEDAIDVLAFACLVAYKNGVTPVAAKAGKCIVGKADDFYSFDSTLKVINSCTSSAEIFQVFKSQLFKRQEAKDYSNALLAEEERRRESIRLRSALMENQNRPVTCSSLLSGFITCF